MSTLAPQALPEADSQRERLDHALPLSTLPPSNPTARPTSRTLRLFLASQAVFQSGTWMQLVAQSWLALELSGSGTTVGWLATATFGPILVLGPWAGALADRLDRRRLLLVTHGLAAAQAAGLGWLALSGALGVSSLYALALVHGLVYAVEHPARRAFVAEVVDEPDLIRATSLTGAVSAAAMVAGPALAGVVIVRSSIGWCFLANAMACLVGLALVANVLPRRARVTDRSAQWRGQAGAGLRYAWKERELRAALLVTAVVTTFGFNHHVVIPVLARRTFGGGAGAYTLLISAMAAGAVLGGVAASRRTSVDLRSLQWSALRFGAALTAGAVAPTLALAVPIAAVIGASGLWFICTATSLLQVRTAAAMRGRVMALLAMVVMGSAPLGGPLVGWVCEQLGPRWALALGAVAALVAGTPWRSLLTGDGPTGDGPTGDGPTGDGRPAETVPVAPLRC